MTGENSSVTTRAQAGAHTPPAYARPAAWSSFAGSGAAALVGEQGRRALFTGQSRGGEHLVFRHAHVVDDDLVVGGGHRVHRPGLVIQVELHGGGGQIRLLALA